MNLFLYCEQKKTPFAGAFIIQAIRMIIGAAPKWFLSNIIAAEL